MSVEERTVEGRPRMLPLLLKAALPSLPGARLLPGVGGHGGALPDRVLHRRDVRVDPGHVARYAEVCSFEPTQALPLTYPHLLAFPLHLGIMTDADFPFPAIGTVHVANSITRHRAVAPAERLDVSVRPADLRAHPRGQAFDLVTTVSAAGEQDPAWESTSTYLRIGRGSEDARPAEAAYEVVAGGGVVWRLPGDLGRRYAAVSGDHNPIHLHPLTARAFGFKRHIAHGMWSKARCVAAMANRLPDAVRVEVEFKKPMFLPGSVSFGSRLVDGGLDFSLTRTGDGAPHLVGGARSLGS